MKVGDLVKRQGHAGIALVLEIKNSNGYVYPEFIWLTGPSSIVMAWEKPIPRFSCSFSLLEVISESR